MKVGIYELTQNLHDVYMYLSIFKQSNVSIFGYLSNHPDASVLVCIKTPYFMILSRLSDQSIYIFLNFQLPGVLWEPSNPWYLSMDI